MSTGVDLAAVLRPVRKGNPFEETVERLLTAIKLGLIAQGERFPPERDLAAQLGIGRTNLREALRELQQAGYVSCRRGRYGGTFVTYTRPAPDQEELSRLAREDGDQLADALTFRLAVESGAAEILAGAVRAGGLLPSGTRVRMVRADVGRGDLVRGGWAGGGPAGGGSAGGGSAGGGPALARNGARAGGAEAGGAEASGLEGAGAQEVLLARLAEVNAARPHDYRRLDTLFHLTIAELTGSSLLLAACTDARMRLNDLLSAIPVLQRNIDHTAGQHAAIVTAILAGDAARARTAVAEHLAGTAALLRGFLT